MVDETESDIGLVNLSIAESITPATPPAISRAASSGLKSPSSPNLLPISPRRPGLSRANTNPYKHSVAPRKASTSLSLDNLTMEPEKVQRLHRWIFCLVVVDFDLEVGPKVTCVYPPWDLSPSEAENIAFSSFPDSPQFEQGSQIHSFRIRARSPTEDKLLRPSDQRPETVDGFLYGYSHFTQRRDATSKRGYQQRSTVILTHLAYPALFYALLEKLGPTFMIHGGPMFEAACYNIATWSDPTPGATLELGFLGTVFSVELPPDIDTQQASQTLAALQKRFNIDSQHHILASLPPLEPPIVALFEACLPQLWSIWECLVLCEPILVYGPSPQMSSQAIWWMRDILRPIPLAGDFRPFFTIHDVDHTTLVNSRPPAAGLILGVTNPYFERACKHWPHILSLGRKHQSKADANTIAGPTPGWKTCAHKRYISRDHALLQQLQGACSGSEKARRDASLALRQHFSSRTAALLVPLQRYLQSLIPLPSTTASTSFPASAIPKSTLTSAFPRLRNVPSSTPVSTASATFPDTSAPSSADSSAYPSPLPTNPPSYANSQEAFPPTPADPGDTHLVINPRPSTHPPQMPPPLNLDVSHSTNPSPDITPTSAIPRLAPFSERAFLASLKNSSGPLGLPFKSSAKAKEFYTRWIRTPAFGVWIARQEEVVDRVLAKSFS